MAVSIHPFLMFIGQADAAIELYLTLFENAELLELQRWEEGQGGEAGKVQLAKLKLSNMTLCVTDSPDVHDFTFTPSSSLFVTCQDEAEIDRLAETLSEGGKFLMPLGDYGFSQKFAWVNDKFGVSWQLNLE